MALELIVNLLLIAGGIFCFVNVSTTMPHSAVNELGAEQWPQAILVLMLIALAFNVIRFFKINKKEDIEAAFKDFFPAIGRFVKSKLFLGMVLVVVDGTEEDLDLLLVGQTEVVEDLDSYTQKILHQ